MGPHVSNGSDVGTEMMKIVWNPLYETWGTNFYTDSTYGTPIHSTYQDTQLTFESDFTVQIKIVMTDADDWILKTPVMDSLAPVGGIGPTLYFKVLDKLWVGYVTDLDLFLFGGYAIINKQIKFEIVSKVVRGGGHGRIQQSEEDLNKGYCLNWLDYNFEYKSICFADPTNKLGFGISSDYRADLAALKSVATINKSGETHLWMYGGDAGPVNRTMMRRLRTFHLYPKTLTVRLDFGGKYPINGGDFNNDSPQMYLNSDLTEIYTNLCTSNSCSASVADSGNMPTDISFNTVTKSIRFVWTRASDSVSEWYELMPMKMGTPITGYTKSVWSSAIEMFFCGYVPGDEIFFFGHRDTAGAKYEGVYLSKKTSSNNGVMKYTASKNPTDGNMETCFSFLRVDGVYFNICVDDSENSLLLHSDTPVYQSLVDFSPWDIVSKSISPQWMWSDGEWSKTGSSEWISIYEVK